MTPYDFHRTKDINENQAIETLTEIVQVAIAHYSHKSSEPRLHTIRVWTEEGEKGTKYRMGMIVEVLGEKRGMMIWLYGNVLSMRNQLGSMRAGHEDCYKYHRMVPHDTVADARRHFENSLDYALNKGGKVLQEHNRTANKIFALFDPRRAKVGAGNGGFATVDPDSPLEGAIPVVIDPSWAGDW